MKLAALLVSSLVVACTTSSGNSPTTSKREAAQALSITSNLLDNLDLEARTTQALTSGTVAFTEPCASSGVLSIAGSFEESDDGLSSSFDLTAGFDACAAGSEVLDGDLHWTEIIEGDSYSDTIVGTLAWTGAEGSASCSFDLTITVDSSGTSYAGTVCGYDVDELQP